MKTSRGLLAILTVAALATAGPVFAGQARAERGAAAKPDAKVSDHKAWEERQALETGKFPPAAPGPQTAGSSSVNNVPTVEISGTIYRIGIDTP